MYVKNENGEVMSSARFAAEIVAMILKNADKAVSEEEAKQALYSSSLSVIDRELLWIQLLERIKKIRREEKMMGYSEAVVCAFSQILQTEVLVTANVLIVMKYVLKLNHTTKDV
jgi:acetamidase/formamidase